VFPMADRLPAPRSANGYGNGHGASAPAADAPGSASPGSAEVQDGPAGEIQQPLLTFAGVCPDCGSSLIYENGCSSCRSCGYSRC